MPPKTKEQKHDEKFKKVKDFLAAHGHKAEKVIGLDMSDDGKLKEAVRELNGMSDYDWRGSAG